MMLLDKSESIVSDTEISFTSSFVRGGNMFFPEKLIFTENKVTLIRNHGASDWYTTVTKQTIPYKKITGVIVHRFLIGCNIVIVGDGYQSIVATAYSGEHADAIEKIVNSIMEG